MLLGKIINKEMLPDGYLNGQSTKGGRLCIWK